MTPQDTRSPFQQQRWLELKNVGSVTIPAFGVCEIVSPGSSRPESTGGYTPDGGRTMLHVRLPTECSHRLTIVNGPCPIPAGESRRVGTMDSPMLALVDSAYYTTGQGVGTVPDSFLLSNKATGYVIIGDYDAGTGTMRVARQDWDRTIRFQLTSKLCRYGSATANSLVCSGGGWTTICGEITVYDPLGIVCPCCYECTHINAYGIAKWWDDCQRWEVITVQCFESSPSNTPSATPSSTVSATPSATVSATPSATVSSSPSNTPSPSATPSASPSNSPSPSATPSSSGEGDCLFYWNDPDPEPGSGIWVAIPQGEPGTTCPAGLACCIPKEPGTYHWELKWTDCVDPVLYPPECDGVISV